MNSSRLTSILSISIGVVLLSGLIVPGLTQQAFAGTVTTLDDIPANVPAYRGNAGSSIFVYQDPGPGDQESCFTGVTPNQVPTPTNSMNRILQNHVGGSGLSGPDGTVTPNPFAPLDGDDTIKLPNWIDEFPIKRIRVQLTYCPLSPGANPTAPTTTIPLSSDGDTCSSVAPGQIVDNPFITGALYYYQDFTCGPNPDWERINFQYNNNDLSLIQLVVDTISDPPPRIGGTFEGVNTMSLLVAGAQTNALWLIPLIAAIGVGIFVARRQFF